VRQAGTLLKFAKATTNPQLAAILIGKAADLKSQVDDSSTTRDSSLIRHRMSNPKINGRCLSLDYRSDHRGGAGTFFGHPETCGPSPVEATL
jgi:hypothetical protein